MPFDANSQPNPDGDCTSAWPAADLTPGGEATVLQQLPLVVERRQFLALPLQDVRLRARLASPGCSERLEGDPPRSESERRAIGRTRLDSGLHSRTTTTGATPPTPAGRIPTAACRRRRRQEAGRLREAGAPARASQVAIDRRLRGRRVACLPSRGPDGIGRQQRGADPASCSPSPVPLEGTSEAGGLRQGAHGPRILPSQVTDGDGAKLCLLLFEIHSASLRRQMPPMEWAWTGPFGARLSGACLRPDLCRPGRRTRRAVQWGQAAVNRTGLWQPPAQSRATSPLGTSGEESHPSAGSRGRPPRGRGRLRSGRPVAGQ